MSAVTSKTIYHAIGCKLKAMAAISLPPSSHLLSKAKAVLLGTNWYTKP
jgi:hypothetical protein